MYIAIKDYSLSEEYANTNIYMSVRSLFWQVQHVYNPNANNMYIRISVNRSLIKILKI